MQNYNEDLLNEQTFLEELIKDLQCTQRKIARLKLRKEQLDHDIICALGHEHEGQKSYEHEIWKVEVRTPCIYSLDRSKYKSGEVNLPDQYNPIKESISYTIDKQLCEFFMETAPKPIRMKLSELIEKKPGKASVSIKERI